MHKVCSRAVNSCESGSIPEVGAIKCPYSSTVRALSLKQ